MYTRTSDRCGDFDGDASKRAVRHESAITHARSGIGDYYTATVHQTWESLHRNRSAQRALGADVAKKIQGNANYIRFKRTGAAIVAFSARLKTGFLHVRE